MAGSADQTADVVLWQGVALSGNIQIETFTGDAAMVSDLFGDRDNGKATTPHPLCLDRPVHADADAAYRRLQDWLNTCQQGGDDLATIPLTLRYPWKHVSQSGATRFGDQWVVLESIWIDRPKQAALGDARLPLGGHLLIPRPSNVDLADKQSIRAGLHKVNNDLSIASMVLDVVALKLQKRLPDESRQQLIQSATDAANAIRRGGETLNAIQARLKP